MIGRIRSIGMTLEGEASITLTAPRERLEELKALADKPVEISIQTVRKKRSVDANSLCWALCRDIAKGMSSPHTDREIYRKAILEVGEFARMSVPDDEISYLRNRWADNGIGWLLEIEDASETPGHRVVRLYYGSSTYKTDEMGRLLDYLLEETKAMGIVPMASAKEIAEAKRRWKS